MLVQVELTTREQVIHQNNLIMQWEDLWQLWSIVLRDSLNILVQEVHVAWLIILLWIR